MKLIDIGRWDCWFRIMEEEPESTRLWCARGGCNTCKLYESFYHTIGETPRNLRDIRITPCVEIGLIREREITT